MFQLPTRFGTFEYQTSSLLKKNKNKFIIQIHTVYQKIWDFWALKKTFGFYLFKNKWVVIKTDFYLSGSRAIIGSENQIK